MTVKVAHVRLRHSRMLFVRAYARETQEMVFDAHDRALLQTSERSVGMGPARGGGTPHQQSSCFWSTSSLVVRFVGGAVFEHDASDAE